ncbi:twin-arginine translocation pathway signal protein [Rhodoferax koreense]|uniref:Twin-arginine translocation pathway signal protein n=1 Tax=Rhodoferax koreensis TaxID=1842727 RepID=A0A1P8JXZ7_9BURK|nr:tripartite tricarboxylate transporter substrate binding protein [Rhodoferax koreense]APW38632.1 twin-arginine translocation pathway signal protein [Rhodoferax koreense]
MNYKSNRRQALSTLALAALPFVANKASAQNFPERPIKIIVPFAPGAGTDAVARLMAQKMGEVMGASFVVENRAGASGAIGAQAVAQAAPDGYTLLLVASPFTTVAASLPNANYDPLHQFAPVGMIASGPLVWATNAASPAHNMKEMVALARQKPGDLNYGSAGAGGVNHLVLELLKSRTGTYITHIPYRGVAPATMDMIAGHIQLVTGTIPALLPFIKDGRVRALAVTSAKRSAALPDVPSMAEAGLGGIDVVNFFALMAPVGTPPAVIQLLNTAINKAVALPEVTARFKLDAIEAAPGSPALLGAFIEADYRAWRNVVRAQKLTIDSL